MLKKIIALFKKEKTRVVYSPSGPIPYSRQAEVMINNLKGFDKMEFEKWFTSGLSIGSNNILQFLMEKEKENGRK